MSSEELEGLMSSRGGKGVKRYSKETSVLQMEGESGRDATREGGISWYKSAYLMLNSSLGASLLNLPRAYHEAGGVLPGNIINVVIAFLALISVLSIVRCCRERDCKTYQELMLHMCGWKASVATSVCIATCALFSCITLLIIIGDQFDRAFLSFAGDDFHTSWYMDRRFTIFAASLLLIVPSSLKKVEALWFVSYVGVLTMFYVTALIMAEFYIGRYDSSPVTMGDFGSTQVLNAVPTICFGYLSHVTIPPIYTCVKPSHTKYFSKVCVLATAVCLLTYSLAATFGYLTFGPSVNSDIILSYDARHPSVLLAVILLALKSWTTYPILFFCGREAFKDMYLRVFPMSSTEVESGEPRRRKLLSLTLWTITVCVAVFIPNIGIVMKILGSVSALFIFVFPGMCFFQFAGDVSSRRPAIKCFKDRATFWLGCFYVVLGTCVFGLSLALGIESIVETSS